MRDKNLNQKIAAIWTQLMEVLTGLVDEVDLTSRKTSILESEASLGSLVSFHEIIDKVHWTSTCWHTQETGDSKNKKWNPTQFESSYYQPVTFTV